MEKADVQRQGQTKEKPEISSLRDGPLYLLNDMELKVVENLQNYSPLMQLHPDGFQAATVADKVGAS